MSNDSFKDINTFNIPYKDKYVHFTFYLVFTLLWYRAFARTGNASRVRSRVFLLALAYGAFIEGLQGLLTAERHADAADILANAAGSAVAILGLWLLRKKRNN